MVDLSIVIVSWNGWDLLSITLRSLRKALAASTISAETIVVDNNSTDDIPGLIHQHFPKVQVIANDFNAGFTKGNNQGITAGVGRYFLMLNPDIEFEVDPLSLQKLVEYADANPDVGAIGPRHLNTDFTLQRSAWRGFPGLTMQIVDAFYLWKAPFLPFVTDYEYRPDELAETRDVDHLLGSCILIRRKTWEEAGLLDELFFTFAVESDWCLRAKEIGWRVVYLPSAQIVHFGQSSARQWPAHKLFHMYRDTVRFYRKHHPRNRLGTAALKLTIVVASLIRMGLWGVRWSRIKSAEDRKFASGMFGGYGKVIRSIASF